MSALLAYQDKTRIVLVSDGCVHGHAEDTFPKFQIIQTRKGPVFIGGVGHRGTIARLFYPLQKMCNEQGFSLLSLQDFLPGAIDYILTKRLPEEMNPEKDIKFPPAQCLLAGFDAESNRMRMWVIVKNGIGTGSVFEVAQNDFIALGFFQDSDTKALCDITAKLRRDGEKMRVIEIAERLAARIDATATKYSDHVGPALFFGAADEKGLIQLPSRMPMPFSIADAVAVR